MGDLRALLEDAVLIDELLERILLLASIIQRRLNDAVGNLEAASLEIFLEAANSPGQNRRATDLRIAELCFHLRSAPINRDRVNERHAEDPPPERVVGVAQFG